MSRSLLPWLLLLPIGCVQPAPPAPTSEASGTDRLYSDAEIRKLARYDIDRDASREKDICKIPCLDVVPPGDEYPRGQVFKTLGLDDRRLQDFDHEAAGFVEFLKWQVSPTYDIICMSGDSGLDEVKVPLDDPNREVYGIRLVQRGRLSIVFPATSATPP